MSVTADRRPAVFLDRDGVIIENCDQYVRRWADVTFISSALETLAQLAPSDYRIVMVTNQSAIGRGLLTLEDAWAINYRIVGIVHESGGRIDASYLCPHAPQDDCDCRKPRPGMLLQAAAELDIDLSRSIMIGDALTDMGAGRAAGVETTLLVRTGRGREQERLIAASADSHPSAVVDDLAAALAWVLSESAPQPRS